MVLFNYEKDLQMWKKNCVIHRMGERDPINKKHTFLMLSNDTDDFNFSRKKKIKFVKANNVEPPYPNRKKYNKFNKHVLEHSVWLIICDVRYEEPITSIIPIKLTSGRCVSVFVYWFFLFRVFCCRFIKYVMGTLNEKYEEKI